ncbi:MAG TPA: hypothetical protein VNG13_04925 [Mycobacteriales bacterium]|nr:hypothetical protein [Mycobacteriales bacterium]
MSGRRQTQAARPRKGPTDSARGAARLVADAILTAITAGCERAAGATGPVRRSMERR